MRDDVCCECITKNLKIKIVRERYVFVGPLPSALPPPLRPKCFLPWCCGSAWLWVIWVIWVIVLNWRQHGHRLGGFGSFGSLFLRDPNDLKAWRQRARSFKALGHLGHFVIAEKSARDAAWASPNSLLRVYPYIKIFYFLN